MIESLHSPHVARVKALIGSRGVKERRSAGFFVAEGLQAAREALTSKSAPFIKHLYVTNSGLLKLSDFDLNEIDVVEVSDAVMAEMTSIEVERLESAELPLQRKLIHRAEDAIAIPQLHAPPSENTYLRYRVM